MAKVMRYGILLSFLILMGNEVYGATPMSGNPLFGPMSTADPCALVYKNTLYVFTGSDETPPGVNSFVMNSWYIFSTTDMVNWTNHGIKLGWRDFSWSSGSTFAGHVVENNGKFYWYCPVLHKTIKQDEGFAIGVAVADHPLGPYKDAIGSALITDNTPNDIALNIDPFVMVDNGIPYLYWGSWGACRYVKLKPNMIQLDGTPVNITPPNFFEAPWIHKRNNTYYFSYSSHGYPSSISYATGPSITGPWTFRAIINDKITKPRVSETNHQAIIQFKGNWYFIYHNAGLPDGRTYHRSVCIDKLEYNSDGTIKKIVQTTTGVPMIEATSAEFQPLSPKNNNANAMFTLQPFSNGKYTITLPGHASTGNPLQISVYSMSGVLKKTINTNYGSGKVSLPSGAHIVRVRDGANHYTRNVVLY